MTYVEVRNEFYKESNMLFIVFDITNQESFDGIDMWLREVSKNGGEKLPVMLVGTKLDLAKNQRKIKKELGISTAAKKGFLGYFETSAKEGNGFFDLF